MRLLTLVSAQATGNSPETVALQGNSVQEKPRTRPSCHAQGCLFIATPYPTTRMAGAMQAAALEKARAGEGRDVEHVALQTPASEVLLTGRRLRSTKPGSVATAAAAAQVPDADAGEGGGGASAGVKRERGRARRPAAAPAAAGGAAGDSATGGRLPLRKRRRAAAAPLPAGKRAART